MTTTTKPVCTGGHLAHDPNRKHRLVDLPCGCQDVHYADGTICFKHAHVECDGTPEET